MALICFLDEDESFAGSVEAALGQHGHEVHRFATPHAFFCQLDKLQPRCAIVDWMLKDMIGVEVVRRLRRQLPGDAGIVILTPINTDSQVVAALEAGADDCIVKPGTNAVLAARVSALMRRLGAEPATKARRIAAGPFVLDFAMQSVRIGGAPVDLTPREFDLAWTLFSNPSRLFTKQELLAAIWGRNTEFGHQTISQHVYSVRKKLALAKHGFKLLAVYASGYRLEYPQTPAIG
jgi:DNA-binding response OmpR family regulator